MRRRATAIVIAVEPAEAPSNVSAPPGMLFGTSLTLAPPTGGLGGVCDLPYRLPFKQCRLNCGQVAWSRLVLSRLSVNAVRAHARSRGYNAHPEQHSCYSPALSSAIGSFATAP